MEEITCENIVCATGDGGQGHGGLNGISMRMGRWHGYDYGFTYGAACSCGNGMSRSRHRSWGRGRGCAVLCSGKKDICRRQIKANCRTLSSPGKRAVRGCREPPSVQPCEGTWHSGVPP